MRNLIIIMTLLSSSLSLVWCQSEPAPAFGSDASRTPDDRMVVPAIVSGGSESALFPAEGERSNYLNGGLSFGTAYDSNPLGMATNPVADVSFMVAPFVSINQTRSRLRWQADYAPGFTFYRRLSERNQDNQSLNLDFEYRLTQHVTMRFQDTFLKTSDFLGGLAQNQQTPFDVNQQSNLTFITPITNQISNTGSGELTYQFGPNSLVGARGFSYELHFPASEQSAGLSDSHSQAAEAFLAHRISSIHWIGVTYRFQHILTDLNDSRTSSQVLLLSYTLNITPSMSVSVFAGPQYTESSSQLVTPVSKWLPAAGATYSWQTTRSGFSAGVARRISDGGGLPGAVQLTSVDGSFRYEWARNWTVRLGGSYGKNQLVETLGQQSQDISSSLGMVGVSHQIGEHVNIEASYVRAHQSSVGTSGTNSFDRNRPQITVSYTFSRPLGR